MPAPSPRLIVEPDDGVDPVRELISSAQNSLLIKQFTFTEEILIEAVIERRNAGVDVRVMLNPARSGGDRANDETFERFVQAVSPSGGPTPSSMSRTRNRSWRAYVLTAVCTAIFVFTKTNPLLVVVAAGVIGYFGIV